MKRVLIYVQHLLGVGHLKRIEIIADALAEQQFSVTVLTGGLGAPKFSNPHISVVHLPGIQSDASFSGLYDENGERIDDAFKKNRISIILDAVKVSSPEIVIVETFPFGRRQLKFEILPLIKAVRNQDSTPAKIFCSIRDIIQPITMQSKIDEVTKLLANEFDAILVHGDPQLIRFEESCHFTARFTEKIRYTGYITSGLSAENNTNHRSKSIVVSAGGGAVGLNLYKQSLSVAENFDVDFQWYFLIGHNIRHTDFDQLCTHRKSNIQVERNREDFFNLLCRASVSISQGGYNTTMDILRSGIQAIVIPFEGSGETEQLTRTQKLANTSQIQMIREKELTFESLDGKLRQALTPVSDSALTVTPAINLDGADRVAEIIRSFDKN